MVTLFSYLPICLFILAYINDQRLTRGTCRAVRLIDPTHPELMFFRPGYSPIGIVLNVLRYKSIGVVQEIPPLERRRLNRIFRAQQFTLVLLGGFLWWVAALHNGSAA